MTLLLFSFFFNDTATTEIYTLSLHDALPIYPAEPPERLRLRSSQRGENRVRGMVRPGEERPESQDGVGQRSEEHTSELQSQSNLVCRLLLEKKKKTKAPSLGTQMRMWHCAVR